MQATLAFRVDGTQTASVISNGWEQISTTLGPGSHLLTWEHTSGYLMFPQSPSLAYLDQLVLPGTTPRQLYETWTAANSLSGPAAEPLATPHGDGVKNLLKYAFNLKATAPDTRVLVAGSGTAGLPTISLVRTPRLLRFEYIRRKGSGLVYTPQKSADLTTWSPLSATPVVTDIPGMTEWERVTVLEPIAPAATPRLLGRVGVTLPPP